jgi:predicted PurR-regulated permease PerM
MFGFRAKDKENTVTLTVTNRTVIRVLILVTLSIIGLAALKRAQHSLTLVFTAIFLAVALNAPVHSLAQALPGRLRGNRTLATSVSFFIVVALLISFLVAIVPSVVRQTEQFISVAPNLIEDTQTQNNELGRFVQKHNLEGEITNASNQLRERLQHSTGTAVATITKIGSSIFSVLTILVLTFMLLIEGPHWVKLAEDLTPSEQRGHMARLARAMYHVVRGYVNGQVTLAALAAVLIFPALLLLGIGYPLALMVVIFTCGLIPMVGHTIGAVIVTIVALFHSLPSAAIILAYYILYQQVENYVIQPRIQANSTNMSPLLVFASVVIGISFGGLIGGLVAIPIAGCLRVITLDYLESRHILKSESLEEAEA